MAVHLADGASCPSRQAIADALTPLVPGARLVETDAELDASIVDLGESYRVSLVTDRVILDAERRCDERARSVALILALAIQEATPEQTEPSPPPPLTAAPSPRPQLAYAVIDRPLVLGRRQGSFRVESSIGAVHTSPVSAPGSALAYSAAVGLGGHTELGLLGGFHVAPNATPVRGTILMQAAFDLHHAVALRVSIGYDMMDVPTSDGTSVVAEGLISALGLGARVRVADKLALTFGGAGSPRTQWITSYDSYYSTLLVQSSQELFTLRYNAQVLQLGIFMPLGFLIQPHEKVSLHLQTGLRLRISGLDVLPAVPVSLDLVITPERHVDVGFSFEAPFDIKQPFTFFNTALFVRSRF